MAFGIAVFLTFLIAISNKKLLIFVKEINLMKKIFTSLFFIAITNAVFAFGDTCCIPIGRKTRHEDIRKEQLLCDKMDGKVDGIYKAGNNDDINNALTELLFRKPNEWRQWIEKNDARRRA